MADQDKTAEESIRELRDIRYKIAELESREIELVQALGEELPEIYEPKLIAISGGPAGAVGWIPAVGLLEIPQGNLDETATAPGSHQPDLSWLKEMFHSSDYEAVEKYFSDFLSGLVDGRFRRARLRFVEDLTQWVELYLMATERDEKGIPTNFVILLRPVGLVRGLGPHIRQSWIRIAEFLDSVKDHDSPLLPIFESRFERWKDPAEASSDMFWLSVAVAVCEAWRAQTLWTLSFVKDRAMKYVWASDPFCKMLGFSLKDMQGRSDCELFGDVDQDAEGRIGEAVLRGVPSHLRRTRMVRGSAQVFQDSLWPIPVGGAGATRWIIGTSSLIDVSERLADGPCSPVMVNVMKRALAAAKSNSVILLTGESGSGKDYLSRRIHDESKRAKGPFFPLNCASIPPNMAESELFGHESGAFTGATKRKRGLLELAEGGTLLLNEIGELSPPLQAKLLTFLDTRTLTRLGGEKSIRVNTRLIAATNRNLEEEVRQGRFRKDLFYRLNVARIEVPPLRERKEDLLHITKRLLEDLCAEMGLERMPTLDRDDINALLTYSWPGNVRELRNVLERALIFSSGRKLALKNFLPEQSINAVSVHETEWTTEVPFPRPDQGVADVLNYAKAQTIEEALRRTRGNKKRAAEMLGIDRHYLTPPKGG